MSHYSIAREERVRKLEEAWNESRSSFPVDVFVKAPEGGLIKDSLILALQIRTYQRIISYIL